MKLTRLAFVALAAIAIAMPVQAQKTLKYAHFQPANPDQPKHAAALAFKESRREGHQRLDQGRDLPRRPVRQGPADDGRRSSSARSRWPSRTTARSPPCYKPIGILGIPFLYDNHEHAWRVYDSPWLKDFSDDMIKKTGIRLLGFADNGVRHFTNSLRPINTPADMKGMKIRIQPSPVFQALVESLGASASAIPWGELPTALQQKVVDGQENSVTNILAASLYQSQKYATLDGHVWSVHGYCINDRFYQGLTPVERKAVDEATQKAIAIHRKMTSEQDKNAKAILEKNGMQVVVPTAASIAEFRKLSQPPVKAWADKEIGKDYVDSLFAAIQKTKS